MTLICPHCLSFLLFRAIVRILSATLTFSGIERESLKRQRRSSHVVADPLGFLVGLSFDPGVDREAGMLPDGIPSFSGVSDSQKVD